MYKIYLIGSLRNPTLPKVGVELRKIKGVEVFDDWFAGGYEADDKWKEYEELRGRSYSEALRGENARHIFEFDKEHLDSSDCAILVTPAGKSGHLELGYMVGKGADTFVYFDGEPERWDVMYRFVDKAFFNMDVMRNEIGVKATAKMGQKVPGASTPYIEVEQRPVDEVRRFNREARQNDLFSGV